MLYVGELMTSKVFTLLKSDSLSDVRALMDLARIRHIPVTDGEKHFLGLVTHRDLREWAVSHLADIKREERNEIESAILVGDIMRTDVTTTTTDALLADAAQILYRNKYGCLPVLDDRKILVGIVTEADVLRLAIALLRGI